MDPLTEVMDLEIDADARVWVAILKSALDFVIKAAGNPLYRFHQRRKSRFQFGAPVPFNDPAAEQRANGDREKQLAN